MDDPRTINWFDPSRLLSGTASQRSAAVVTARLLIVELLSDYSPVLCGDVPIDCDIPSSSLIFACQAPRPIPFRETLYAFFEDRPAFVCEEKQYEEAVVVAAGFVEEGRRLEIVGRPLPVVRQSPFMQMAAEALLLFRGEEGANERIRQLKREGLTTEEAFARLFRLPCDPSEALADIYMKEILGSGVRYHQ
jgi:hypothetical protein